jgi:hypothetical protein
LRNDQYVKTVWENNQAPPISAENLNKIEDCLERITGENVLNFDLLTGTGSGVLYKIGNTCQLVITMNNPIAIGGFSDLLQFPEEFKPAMDFYTQAIGTNYGDTLGLISYNSINNMLSLNTSYSEAFMAKVSFSYICAV